MTSTFPTNLIGPGTQFTFAAAGDFFHILEGVIVASTSGGTNAVVGFQGNQSLRIDGTLASDGKAALLAGPNNDVTIGKTGVVVANEPSAGNHGIALNGTNNVVTNDGAISASSTVALLGEQMHVTNRGTIDGASGVFLGLFDSPGSSLVNSGSITANASDDASRGTRFNNAVYAEDTARIVNTTEGVISAVSSEGAGVRIGTEFGGGNGSTVLNRGEIHSLRHVGIDASELVEGDGVRVTNFGLVSGGDGSVSLSRNDDTLINRGTLDGDVRLGAGSDVFDGRFGEVLGSVAGGTGDDTYSISDPDLVLIELPGEGTDTVRSRASYSLADDFENLELLGDGNINGRGTNDANIMTGNAGNNVLTGRGGADVISGMDGDDKIAGGFGADVLDGGAGDDRISGSFGVDTINGGSGDDVISGGARGDTISGDSDGSGGRDMFVFRNVTDSLSSAPDQILDFVSGEDLLNLVGIDADETTPGNDAFVFLGIGVAFTGTAGELRGRPAGNLMRIEGDTDGDASADLVIVLRNGAQPTEDDFVL